MHAPAALVVGLLILSAACSALVTASQRLAARLAWDHYVAGTVAEILSTVPELVVIAFLVPVSPQTAFIVALVTIYNNAVVFSIYSFFLPKDRQGKFLMPLPITSAGAQILVAGAAMGLILGLVMMAMEFGDHPKDSFAPLDLGVIGVALLGIFCVYVYRLLGSYARVEERVSTALQLTAQQVETRRALVYIPVHASSWALISAYLGTRRSWRRAGRRTGRRICPDRAPGFPVQPDRHRAAARRFCGHERIHYFVAIAPQG